MNLEAAPIEEKSTRNEKQHSAFEGVSGHFERELEKVDERLKENPNFVAKGREYPIENAGDRLVAEAQVKKMISLELLDTIQGEGDYYREKAALKLTDFFEKNEEMIARYVELKLNHPEFVTIIDSELPNLKNSFSEAEAQF
ncbi:hypothetical protein COB64_01870 [Candidatus Wolfebacteria bacterium]|nr:MAG: hypothetical protein COB64_01870 [Candidatus Wolfebacteria bacterium]